MRSLVILSRMFPRLRIYAFRVRQNRSPKRKASRIGRLKATNPLNYFYCGF